MINLDTHVLLDAVRGILRPDEEAVLRQNAWTASDIVLWEITKLYRSGRINISVRDPDLSRLLAGMTLWPITLQVAEATLTLDFDSDPADEIIAATSIAHDVPLLTRDMRILRSKVVPLALS